MLRVNYKLAILEGGDFINVKTNNFRNNWNLSYHTQREQTTFKICNILYYWAGTRYLATWAAHPVSLVSLFNYWWNIVDICSELVRIYQRWLILMNWQLFPKYIYIKNWQTSKLKKIMKWHIFKVAGRAGYIFINW